MAVLVKLLSKNAIIPARASKMAAGYDLSSTIECNLPARGRVIIDTGICIALPFQTYGRVAPRSGLATRHSIDVGAGVIDCDYRGEIKVLLFNHSDQNFEIKIGDRIAQLIIEKIDTPEVIVVDDLDETDRGLSGFGSTGLN